MMYYENMKKEIYLVEDCENPSIFIFDKQLQLEKKIENVAAYEVV